MEIENYVDEIEELPSKKIIEIISDNPEGATRWGNGRYFKSSGSRIYWYSTEMDRWFLECKFNYDSDKWDIAYLIRDLKRELKRRTIESKPYFKEEK